ncbi:MAG: hypothetical protein WC282_00280 [Bacilli bacterium]|jgi:hypothetical protein
MLRIGKSSKMTPRPDNEPNFDPNNNVDRKIVVLVIVSLLIVALLVVGLIILYKSNIWVA